AADGSRPFPALRRGRGTPRAPPTWSMVTDVNHALRSAVTWHGVTVNVRAGLPASLPALEASPQDAKAPPQLRGPYGEYERRGPALGAPSRLLPRARPGRGGHDRHRARAGA